MNELFSNLDVKTAVFVVTVSALSVVASLFVFLRLFIEVRGQKMATDAKLNDESSKTKADGEQNDERMRRYVLDMADQSNKNIDRLTVELDKLRALISTLEKEKAYDAGRYDTVTTELAAIKQENTHLRDEITRLEYGQKTALEENDRLRNKIESQAQRITDLEALNRAVSGNITQTTTQTTVSVDLPTTNSATTVTP